MSDLRDRIVAALEDALESVDASASGYGSEYVSVDEDGVAKLDGQFYLDALADAVIAELGLYREGSESRTVTNEWGATYRIEGGHRYVTEWKADDE